MNTIKLAISELRKERGLTQKELANLLGVSFQAVSKWENGATLPDVSLLPALSEIFKVSVDQVLGLKSSYNAEHTPRNTHTAQHWDDKVPYLESTRNKFWNPDYFEFLVEKVWKLHRPVNVIDYGCGYGFLGEKLLEILPKGSTYTGLDISEELLRHGQKRLGKFGEVIKFIHTDIQTYQPKPTYDVAICQAFIRHVPNSIGTLKKMMASVRPSGLVICIEVNRAFEAAGTLIEEYPYRPWQDLNQYSKLWECELDNEDRDFAAGLRLPQIMTQIGLKNVDIRMNDKVSFLSKTNESSQDAFDTLRTEKGWRRLEIEKRNQVIDLLENRGYSVEQIKHFIQSNEEVSDYLDAISKPPSLVSLTGTLISYGYK